MEKENQSKNPSMDIEFRWAYKNGKLQVIPILNKKVKSDKERNKRKIAKQSKQRNRK
jgi:hypothetical protein